MTGFWGKLKSSPTPHLYRDDRGPETAVTAERGPARDTPGVSPSELHFRMGLRPPRHAHQLALFPLQTSQCSAQPCFSEDADSDMCGLPYALFPARRPPASAVPRGGTPAARHRHNMFIRKGSGQGGKRASSYGDCSKSSPVAAHHFFTRRAAPQPSERLPLKTRL